MSNGIVSNDQKVVEDDPKESFEMLTIRESASACFLAKHTVYCGKNDSKVKREEEESEE